MGRSAHSHNFSGVDPREKFVLQKYHWRGKLKRKRLDRRRREYRRKDPTGELIWVERTRRTEFSCSKMKVSEQLQLALLVPGQDQVGTRRMKRIGCCWLYVVLKLLASHMGQINVQLSMLTFSILTDNPGLINLDQRRLGWKWTGCTELQSLPAKERGLSIGLLRSFSKNTLYSLI